MIHVSHLLHTQHHKRLKWERWICGSGQCRSGQFGTILQGWNL